MTIKVEVFDGVVIGVALFEGAEELDWAGPWEVLAAWAGQWPDDGVRVFTVARSEGPITCAKGLRVLPDETWESASPLDVLVYPAAAGLAPSSPTPRCSTGSVGSRGPTR